MNSSHGSGTYSLPLKLVWMLHLLLSKRQDTDTSSLLLSNLQLLLRSPDSSSHSPHPPLQKCCKLDCHHLDTLTSYQPRLMLKGNNLTPPLHFSCCLSCTSVCICAASWIEELIHWKVDPFCYSSWISSHRRRGRKADAGWGNSMSVTAKVCWFQVVS